MASPFNLSLGRQISIAESALKRNTTLRNFFKIEQKADGSGYEFVFTPTGDRFSTAQEATDHITGLHITDYRTFNATGLGIGERRGAKHIGEEAKALNTRLQRSTMDPRTRDVLIKMDLEQYIDEAMTVEYLKFDFGGGKEELDAFMNSPFGQKHGMLNVTDDGIMVMRYKDSAGNVIDSTQMKQLQYALGLGTLTDKFVDDLMTKDSITVGKKVAKLPKRYKALFSARGFAIAGEDLEESILEFHAARLAMNQFATMKITGATDEAKRIPQLVRAKIKEAVSYYSDLMSDTDLNDFIARLGNDYADAGGNLKDFKNNLEKIATDNAPEISTAKKEDFAYAKKALAIFDGVERARDGEAITSMEYWQSRVNFLQDKLTNLKASIGIPIGLEEQSMIDDIEKEIEAIVYKMNHAKSQTMRGAFEGSSLKFEDIVRSFDNMPRELRDKMMIVYGSSLKEEISQGNIDSILMDMSMSAPKPVRVDPLMLMYHPDYMNADDFFKGMESTVQRQMQKADKFMKTGIVDKNILESIRREAEAPLDQYSRTLKS